MYATPSIEPRPGTAENTEHSTDDGIDRTKRIKEARDEAKKEIEAYKKQKEEEFKKFEAEVRTHRPAYLAHSAIWNESMEPSLSRPE